MWLGRVPCAVALSWVAACSFPAYTVPTDGGGSSGGPSAPPSCNNGLRDGKEDKVDCGGPECNPCPRCSDGLKNGEETGVDCGGECEACPTCTDGMQNGSESDQDCGGICSQRCQTDQRCRQGTDCAALVCADNVCQPSSCNDQVRNGLETGKDCGGGGCEGCENGESCEAGADCKSLHCKSNVCVSAACTDGVPDGNETDVDCGGGECARCPAGKKCEVADDCESRICGSNLLCAQATCSDATLNQDETGVDCGGSCGPCGPGLPCIAGDDCSTGLCQSGLCVPEFSLGQPLGRAGWTLRTSESGAQASLVNIVDTEISSCWTSGTPQYAGMYVELDLGEPRYFFKARIVVETPPYERDFPSRLSVYVSNDGTFGDPVQTVTGYTWTWIDITGAQVGRYVRFSLAQGGARPWSVGDITLYD